MSIDFKLDNIDIENRKKIYEKLNDGKRQLSIKTQTIIWYCAKIIGVQKIDNDNYNDTFNRIFEYEEIFGTKAVRWEDVYNDLTKKKQQIPIYYSIELEDVNLLIGLEIECEQLTKEEWKLKIIDIRHKLYERTKELEKDMQEKYEVKYVDMRKISETIPEPESKNLKDTLPFELPDNPLVNTKLEENEIDNSDLKKDK